MKSIALLRGIRYLDSFFPSGGFAYSSGLEAAVSTGAVRNGRDLDRYTREYLGSAIGRREAVAVGHAHGAAAHQNLQRLTRVDRDLHAMAFCRETREGSMQMGRQILRVAAEAAENPGIARTFLDEVEAGRTPGHLAPVLGMTFRRCGWRRQEAVAGFLYQMAVGFASAALKVLPIGQNEVQRLFDGWLSLIDDVAFHAMRASALQAWAPIHEIHAMRHHRLPVRLFRS